MTTLAKYTILLAPLSFLASIAFAAQISGSPVQVAGWNRNDPANFADGRPALLTRFSLLTSVAVGPDGLTVLAGNSSIRKIGSDGLVHTLLENAGADSYFRTAIDSSGDIYYSITLGIGKLTASGATSRIAGIGTGKAQDGVAATSVGVSVVGLAVNPSGDVVFSDGQTARIWRIDSAGVIHAVAGTATSGTGGEGGPAASAQLEFPGALAYDAAGDLYIMDEHRILQVRPDGTLVRLAGPSAAFGHGPLAVTHSGTVYYTPTPGYSVARLNTDGSSTPIAGGVPSQFSNGCGSGADPTTGTATTATFGVISGLAIDPSGNVLAIDQSNSTLRQIDATGKIRTVAGGPPLFGGDGGPATAATFGYPQAIAFDAARNMYVADTGNNRIRKITTDGVIHTVGGQGGPTADMVYSCSGSSPNYLHAPAALALDPAGTVYIADTLNHRVVKLAADGTPVLFAGTGTSGYAVAKPGTKASTVPLNSPRAVGIDRDGNIWVGDNATRTLKIDPSGVIVNVLPGIRTRSFSTDAQQNLYLTSELISYQVIAGDQLVPLAGSGYGASIPTDGPDPVVAPDDTNDVNQASGITRDAQGTIYSLGNGGQLISTACQAIQMPMFAPQSSAYGFWYVAESPQGDVYAPDPSNDVIWRLPHLKTSATDLPTPVFTYGAMVQSAASQLIAVLDTYEQTGGFTSSPARFIISDNPAPGEIVRIEGQCLGPFNAVQASFDSNGRLPKTLGGVQVSIGGIPAPLVSVQAGGIVAIVPFGLPTNQPASFSLTYNGVTINNTGSTLQALQPVAYRPGVVRYLELDGSSTVAAINQDGTLNSQAHPAPAGSVIAFWATGLGQTNPPGVDGQMQTDISARYLADIHVTIGGMPAPVQYAGPAPGFAALSQINVQVPQGKSGAEPLQLLMGTAPFQQTVQVWVQ